jgi:Nif-specific regulatory protein
VLPLDGAVVSFGRDSGNTICFLDPALSRRHCEFARADGRWSVRDLASANGTFVNGVRVAEQALTEGDRIAVGGSILLYVGAAPVAHTSPPLAHGLRVLLRISAVIHAIPNEEELHREVLRLLVEAVPAHHGAIVLLGADGALTTAATLTRNGDGRVAISARTDGKWPDAPSANAQPRPPRNGAAATTAAASLMTVPLAVRSQTLGAIHLAAADREAFTDDQLELVTAVSRIAAIALDNVRHCASLPRETDRLPADGQLAHNMVGEHPVIRRVYDRIAKIARTDSTVLIAGETGTGKELVARAIHLNGARACRPFVAINCAALAEQLLESELFGHERGAFTGAVAQKKGKLEVANGGTLFLDEVSELAPTLQSKLLRVLQEREFERIGGTRPIKVDVRLISATNRVLAEEIARGRFREDLYFRLNVVSIEMPPLRHRRSDIPLLTRHFLSRCARKCDRRIACVSPAAMAALMSYEWPGNVRELENAIERAVVLGVTEQIALEDLPHPIVDASMGRSGPGAANIHGAVLDTKKRAIVDAFRRTGGSYTATARLLGVHPNYLHRLIRNLGIKSQLEV